MSDIFQTDRVFKVDHFDMMVDQLRDVFAEADQINMIVDWLRNDLLRDYIALDQKRNESLSAYRIILKNLCYLKVGGK